MLNPFKKEPAKRIETKMPIKKPIEEEVVVEEPEQEEVEDEVHEEEAINEEVEAPKVIQPVFPTQQDINAMIWETHAMVKELFKSNK